MTSAIVHLGKYFYYKSKVPIVGDHFMVSEDEDEVTIVTKEKLEKKSEGPFTLIEVRPEKPFQEVGFIAKITKALADKGLNVLVVSTYSKDYFLVRCEELSKAQIVLSDLGFEVQ